MQDKHLCEQGFDCLYRRISDHTRGTCMHAHCQKEEFEYQGKTYVRDKLTGTASKWVNEVINPYYEPPDEELLQRQADYKRMMEKQTTFERHHGAVRPKRVAT